MAANPITMANFLKVKLNIILGIIALLLGYATCKNLKKTAETAETTQAPAPKPEDSGTMPSGFRAAHVFNMEHPDTAAAIQVNQPPHWVDVPIDALPPASASHKAYLCNDDKYWHFNMAFAPTNKLVHEHYKDRYVKFRPDQSFSIVYKGKIIDNGRWNWDRDKNEIYLSCTNPYVNNTWKVIDKGNVMIWTGSTELNVSGIQIRVVATQKPSDFSGN